MAAETFHRLPSYYLEHPVHIDLAGCGGTGSMVLTELARLDRALIALGHPGGLNVTVWDPDRVTEANIGRQLFAPADLGAFKSEVLVSRLNLFYGLNWAAEPDFYRGGKDVFHGPRSDFLITCVDSAAARSIIWMQACQHYKGSHTTPQYWLDTGNSVDSGQVVLGELRDLVNGRKDEPRLPHVLEVFPELLDSKRPEDPRPSCSLAEALEQQDLMINRAVATWAVQLLWTLFRKGQIRHHGYFINLASGMVNPLPVPAPPKAKRSRKTRMEGRR